MFFFKNNRSKNNISQKIISKTLKPKITQTLKAEKTKTPHLLKSFSYGKELKNNIHYTNGCSSNYWPTYSF